MVENIFSEEIVDEPDDIERVIVAGGDDGHGGSGRESENEETKKDDENAKEKIKIKRKIGPRPIINVQRLRGPRGIGIMQSFFSDLKFKGKSNEKADLQLLMGRLEHWAHRLCPRTQFDEALKKIEKLGAKKEISNYVKRIRLGMEDGVDSESVIEHEPPNTVPDVDPFDQLVASTDVPEQPTPQEMTEEQRDRMLQNRLIAEEKRKARLERAQELKAKFLENQKLQSQREVSQIAESDLEAQNQNIESQRNNVQEEQMEIDENLIPGSISILQSNNVDEKNVSDIADIQIEKNYNQSNFAEKDKENSSSMKQIDPIGQDIPIEGVDNCMGILTERNKAHYDIIEVNRNCPDIV